VPNRPDGETAASSRWSGAIRLKTLNGDVAKAAASGEAPARALSDLLVHEPSVAYTFIAPACFLLLFLVAYPFLLSVWFSLSDARVGETGAFVGLDNFRRLLGSSIFLQTLENSIVFTGAGPGAQDGLRHGPRPGDQMGREGDAGDLLRPPAQELTRVT